MRLLLGTAAAIGSLSAAPASGDEWWAGRLSFATQNPQSAWGSGAAARLEGSEFLGAE